MRTASFGPALCVGALGLLGACSSPAGDDPRDQAAAQRMVGTWSCEITGAEGPEGEGALRSTARVRFWADGRREEQGTLAFEDAKGGIWLYIASSGRWRIEGDKFYSATENAEVLRGEIDGAPVDPEKALPRLVSFIENPPGREEAHRITRLGAGEVETVHTGSGVRTRCTRM